MVMVVMTLLNFLLLTLFLCRLRLRLKCLYGWYFDDLSHLLEFKVNFLAEEVEFEEMEEGRNQFCMLESISDEYATEVL